MTVMPDRLAGNRDYARRHLHFGWWSLFFFAGLGFVLELLHAFKVGMYLDVSNESRRLMWRLAHTHGTLLSVVHIVFGLGTRVVPELGAGSVRLISWCLIGASLSLPGGFFVGGIATYAGDPGVGAILVPIGATLLLIAIFLVARRVAWVGRAESPGRGNSSRSRGNSARNAAKRPINTAGV